MQCCFLKHTQCCVFLPSYIISLILWRDFKQSKRSFASVCRDALLHRCFFFLLQESDLSTLKGCKMKLSLVIKDWNWSVNVLKVEDECRIWLSMSMSCECNTKGATLRSKVDETSMDRFLIVQLAAKEWSGVFPCQILWLSRCLTTFFFYPFLEYFCYTFRKWEKTTEMHTQSLNNACLKGCKCVHSAEFLLTSWFE